MDITKSSFGGLPERFIETTDQAVERAEKVVQEWNGAYNGRIRAWFQFRGIPNSTDQLITRLKELADRLQRNPPVVDPNKEAFDLDYWQFGTLAMFQVGGAHWKRWNRSMKTAIAKSQKPKGHQDAGSWDPVGRGMTRAAATASSTSVLEVCYPYDRVFGNPR